ncbi:MAG: DUF2065 domain-containing protein [Gammaproteobacteria bacterium]|nr:DUF2065 domain-containing protein [Gammaproteobacteria bacterium]
MTWEIILSAIALLLVFEGIVPFVSPRSCKRMMRVMSNIGDRPLRIMGLIAMLLGAGLMVFVHIGIL